MKKLMLGVLTIGVVVIFLHIIEQKAWRKWKLEIHYVIYVEESLMKKNGYTLEEANVYGDKLIDSLGIEKPMPCPYCFINKYIHRH